MRYVSWNMGCAPPMAKRYRRTHSEAWDYLLAELRPDVALVQEALFDHSSTQIHGGQLFWSEDRGSDGGTAVWIRRGLLADRVTIRCEGSYIAAIQLQTGPRPILIASVHVGPPNYRRHLRALVDVLSKAVAEQRFVVAGDLNAARHIDVVYKGRWFTRFFDDLARRGFCDCHWRRHGKEVQSFWGRQTRNAYQCDHFLVDSVTDKGVVNCDVVDNGRVRELSDHGPIQMDTVVDAVEHHASIERPAAPN